jgi:hypothetical protein
MDKLYFPTIVDNFFDNPDKIREYALSLEYKPCPDGNWPGMRSQPLHELDKELYMAIVQKILSIYNDFYLQGLGWSNGKIQFHLNKGIGDKDIDTGWIHTDDNFQLAGVCYLNPGDVDMNTGTSILSLKKEKIDYKNERQDYKHKFLKGEQVDINEYKKSLKNHNDNFEETIRIANVYNRMITYASPEFHCLNGLPKNESRLTMLLFMSDIKPDHNRFPFTRVKDSKRFDDIINNRIDHLKGDADAV